MFFKRKFCRHHWVLVGDRSMFSDPYETLYCPKCTKEVTVSVKRATQLLNISLVNRQYDNNRMESDK